MTQRIARIWLPGVALAGCTIVGCFALGVSSALATGTRPVIESLSASSGGEPSIKAKIDPGGLDTYYGIKIECALREEAGPCETALSGPAIEGQIAGAGGVQEVSLNVAGLKSGSYSFSVVAENAAGGASRQGELTIPAAHGELYEREPAGLWGEESGRLRDAEYWAQVHLAEEAAAAHARELRQQEEARLAAEAAKKESERKKAAQRACVVPSLRGDSLAVAKRALARAHCRLGKVTRRSHSRVLAVVDQSPRRGDHLGSGAAVMVMLGRRPRRGS